MRLAGVVLAGGQATRMGGGDKTLLPLGRGCLLDSVLARLAPQVAAIVLNANGDAGRFARFGLPVVGDSIGGFVGPLGGVLAGMDWAAEAGFDAVLSVAGDTPFFPDDLAVRLLAERGDAPIAMASGPAGGRNARHPTFALWSVGLRAALRDELGGGLRKVVAFSHSRGCVDVAFPDDGAFFNVNTPEDLAEARARMGEL